MYLKGVPTEKLEDQNFSFFSFLVDIISHFEYCKIETTRAQLTNNFFDFSCQKF